MELGGGLQTETGSQKQQPVSLCLIRVSCLCTASNKQQWQRKDQSSCHGCKQHTSPAVCSACGASEMGVYVFHNHKAALVNKHCPAHTPRISGIAHSRTDAMAMALQCAPLRNSPSASTLSLILNHSAPAEWALL